MYNVHMIEGNSTSDNPNGYVYDAAPSMCYSRLTNNLWIKVDQGWSSTGWVLLIGNLDSVPQAAQNPSS